MNTAPTTLQQTMIAGAIAVVSMISGGWINDRLKSESRDTSSAVRIEALDARVTSLAGELAATRTGSLSAAQFQEFRQANDQRLDSIRQDIRDLIAEVNSEKPRR